MGCIDVLLILNKIGQPEYKINNNHIEKKKVI